MKLRARLVASTAVLLLLGAGDTAPAKAPQAAKAKVAPVDAAQAKAPQAKAPQAKAEQAKAPQAKVEQAKAPQAKAPQAQVPQAKAAQAKAAQAKAAQAKPPQPPEGAQVASDGTAAVEPVPTLRVAELAWLAGRWEGLHDDVVTEETWLEPRGGLMLGVQRSVAEEQTDFRYLRLEQTAEGVHLVSSAGAQATRLRVVETAPWRIVFAHSGLAWPQRVQYARTAGGMLFVRLEGVRDGKATVHQWTARRVDREVQAAATEH